MEQCVQLQLYQPTHLAFCKDVHYVADVLRTLFELQRGFMDLGLQVLHVLALPRRQDLPSPPQSCDAVLNDKFPCIMAARTGTVGAQHADATQVADLPVKVELADEARDRFTQGNDKAGVLEAIGDARRHERVGQRILDGLCTDQGMPDLAVAIAGELQRCGKCVEQPSALSSQNTHQTGGTCTRPAEGRPWSKPMETGVRSARVASRRFRAGGSSTSGFRGAPRCVDGNPVGKVTASGHKPYTQCTSRRYHVHGLAAVFGGPRKNSWGVQTDAFTAMPLPSGHAGGIDRWGSRYIHLDASHVHRSSWMTA